MCGITGYIGQKDAYPIIINGLKRLEYRGYDSAGIMIYDGEDIHLSKTKGKVSALEQIIENDPKRKVGTIGAPMRDKNSKYVPHILYQEPFRQRC